MTLSYLVGKYFTYTQHVSECQRWCESIPHSTERVCQFNDRIKLCQILEPCVLIDNVPGIWTTRCTTHRIGWYLADHNIIGSNKLHFTFHLKMQILRKLTSAKIYLQNPNKEIYSSAPLNFSVTYTPIFNTNIQLSSTALGATSVEATVTFTLPDDFPLQHHGKLLLQLPTGYETVGSPITSENSNITHHQPKTIQLRPGGVALIWNFAGTLDGAETYSFVLNGIENPTIGGAYEDAKIFVQRSSGETITSQTSGIEFSSSVSLITDARVDLFDSTIRSFIKKPEYHLQHQPMHLFHEEILLRQVVYSIHYHQDTLLYKILQS